MIRRRGRPRLQPAPVCGHLVRGLAALLDADQRPMKAIAHQSGVPEGTITGWRRGVTPLLPNVEAVFAAVGCRLVAVPIKEPTQ